MLDRGFVDSSTALRFHLSVIRSEHKMIALGVTTRAVDDRQRWVHFIPALPTLVAAAQSCTQSALPCER
jgi:hypothetical protein